MVSLWVAAFMLLGAGPAAAAGPGGQPPEPKHQSGRPGPGPAASQLAEVDRFMRRFRIDYARTERFLKAGPPAVAASTQAVAAAKAQQRLAAFREVVARDQAALAAYRQAPSSGTALAQAVAACMRGFSLDGMYASFGKDWTFNDVASVRENFVNAVALSQACLYVASGLRSPAAPACEGHGPLFTAAWPMTGNAQDPDHDASWSVERLCQLAMKKAQNMSVAAEGPEAYKRLCLQRHVSFFTADKQQAACDIVARSLSDPKTAARKLAPLMSVPPTPRTLALIEKDLETDTGALSPQQCAALPPDFGPLTRDFCLIGHAFHRARAGGGVDACGSLGLCRALMGAGRASCDGTIQQAKALFCRRDQSALKKELDARLQRQRAREGDLRRDQEELKRLTDAWAALSSSASPNRRTEEFRAQAQAKFRELRRELDQGFALLDAVEPKSVAGIAERREALGELQDGLNKELEPLIRRTTDPRRGAR